ncbi:hypothetical protein CFC21_059932, partial [Triticum aestivum]
RRRSRRRKR